MSCSFNDLQALIPFVHLISLKPSSAPGGRVQYSIHVPQTVARFCVFPRAVGSGFDSCGHACCLCFRSYAVRRVRDAFRTNRTVSDPTAVEKLITEGQQTLALIRRQVGHTHTHTGTFGCPVCEDSPLMGCWGGSLRLASQ